MVRSQELSLYPLEKIKKELKPQGVTEVKRVSIQTPTLWLWFANNLIKNKNWLHNEKGKTIYSQFPPVL